MPKNAGRNTNSPAGNNAQNKRNLSPQKSAEKQNKKKNTTDQATEDLEVRSSSDATQEGIEVDETSNRPCPSRLKPILIFDVPDQIKNNPQMLEDIITESGLEDAIKTK